MCITKRYSLVKPACSQTQLTHAKCCNLAWLDLLPDLAFMLTSHCCLAEEFFKLSNQACAQPWTSCNASGCHDHA